ncbi:ABC-2 family transporter protein [Anaerococcus octavius]|uniref:ABC-2 family transporter protein n=1 Tax=Anaerococcus octavius TaxID=54007 RepID=A0A380WX05_9FIRM|nr:ABC transporter permease [Anaerococcus octavius]SUU92744.1 ABC-2 family transporter protein [Anaerococcus octavius]
MKIYLNEIKRILSIRSNQIIILLSLFLAILFSIVPINFTRISYKEGNEVKNLKGKQAIEYIKKAKEPYSGNMTEDLIYNSTKKYREVLKQNNVTDRSELKPEINTKELMPMEHISKKVNEVFTDIQSNNLSPVLSMDINDNKNFYNKVFDYLNMVIKSEYPNKAQNQIMKKSEKALDKIKTPYEYYGYYNTNANDYRGFYNTIIILLMVVVAAPIFSSDSENDLDYIFKTTKYGRRKFAIYKILAILTISVLTLLLGNFIQGSILDYAFGTEYKKTSVQMMFSALSLHNWNFGQFNKYMLICNSIILISTILATLIISVLSKRKAESITKSIILSIFPTIISPIAMISAINYVFPSSGIGLINSLQNQIADFNFVNVFGNWMSSSNLIMISAVIYIIVLPSLIVIMYSKQGGKYGFNSPRRRKIRK